MALTPQQKLEQAEQDYHDLVTGNKARVFVDQNGERVEYVQANAARLAAYINDLKVQLGISTAPRGPMRVWF